MIPKSPPSAAPGAAPPRNPRGPPPTRSTPADPAEEGFAEILAEAVERRRTEAGKEAGKD